MILSIVLAQSSSEITSVLDAVQAAGLLGLLVVIVWGAVKEWWVPGKRHKDTILAHEKEKEILRKERDDWRDLTLEGVSLTTRTVSAAERVTEHVTRE